MSELINNIEIVNEFHKQMQKHQFLLCYRGNISQEISVSLLSMAEKKMSMEGVKTNIKKRVFNVMLECMQNICKSDDSDSVLDDSIIMIGNTDNSYIICSGSVISTSKVNQMKQIINQINTLDREELKKQFRMFLVSSQESQVANTTLGLIDIAKKSANKLEYSIAKLDENNSFFSLKTIIQNQ
jgi:hypothetical protein